MFRFVALQHLFTIALCTTLLTTGACVNRSNNTDPVTELLPALVLTLSQNVLIIGDSLTDYSSGFGLQARLGPGYTVDFRYLFFFEKRVPVVWTKLSRRPARTAGRRRTY